jgi:hypothetical protein
MERPSSGIHKGLERIGGEGIGVEGIGVEGMGKAFLHASKMERSG